MKGYKADREFSMMEESSSLIQPRQMLPYKDKDDKWRAWNMDWLERLGMDQINNRARHISKNYRLANGIIDKSDYIVSEDDENKDILDALIRITDPTEGLAELKFFPIIPQMVDMMVGEYIKRSTKVMAYAVDPLSRNEKIEKKKELVDRVLQEQARMDIMQQMIEMGADLEDEEVQQQLSDESIQSLPDVENYMRKSYRGMVEQWCSHQMASDRLRFRMDELETIGFRDSLICDMVFWEVRLYEDDYEPVLLDPRMVFYHKPPGQPYTHRGNLAGYVELLDVSSVIDTHGYKMSESEIRSLQQLYPARSANHLIAQNYDGNYWDSTKSAEENQKGGSIAMKQYQAWEDTFGNRKSNSLFDYLLDENMDNILSRDLIRVTTGYWKSQRRVGHLIRITEEGEMIQDIVSEEYVVTDKPIYDTTFYKEKTKDNLVFGEHVDWIWINEVWGGIKIGPNSNSVAISSEWEGFRPIYLGVGNKRKPDRLPFQFKGESSIYGAAIPIIGARFSERASKSVSFVDRPKPFQVSYNMVNNMISDILIDDLGTVIVLDQNTLPRHSMGEDWGKNNLAKAYVAMKDFKILPLDTTLSNTESAVNFQNMQVLDASQTNRLLGLIQLSNYFKMEALASIGITPERMGTVNSQTTATGTQVSVNNSYSQTEKYFTQYCDYLMPRVWEMILSAAQYYHSTGKTSRRLSYINDKGHDIIWGLPDSLDLLPRDIDVHCTTTYSAKELKNKLEQLALENNTTDATIYDLGRMLTLDTPTEFLDALQESEAKMMRRQKEQQDHEAQLQQQMIEAQQQALAMEKQFEASENQKDREARLLEVQIQAAGYTGGKDVDGNAQSDYLDSLKFIQEQQAHADGINFKREQETNKMQMSQQQMQLKMQELQTRKEVAEKQLQIARENQTKAELERRRKKKEQATKKKK
jgi:hypothetical protein